MSKRKKVVIIGGAGYIGNELLNIHEWNDCDYDIAVLDRRFVPRVARGTSWHGWKYIQGDIRDKKVVKKAVKNADIVYHLAAITGAKSSCKNPNEVWDINYKGAVNVLDAIPKKCKFIFASSCNVFGGWESGEILNATENVQPKPKYPYAETKRAVEEYLFDKFKGNFIIVRFGANYGYNPSMRMNLVGNLFAKMTLQNDTIKLFGGGNNYRPLTCVEDSARVLKFLAENDLYNREIFHCNSENMRIKDIAKICKEINHKVKIKKTSDDVPFASYSCSNLKLLRTGFKFEHNIKDELKKMITEQWKSLN